MYGQSGHFQQGCEKVSISRRRHKTGVKVQAMYVSAHGRRKGSGHVEMSGMVLPVSMQMGGLPQALGGAYAMGGSLGAHMAGAHMAAGGGLGGQMPMGGQSAMLMSAPMPYPSVQPLPGGAFAASAGDPGPQAGPCTSRNARSAVDK